MASQAVIGKYRFLMQLSASSFSEVWLARPETGNPSAPLVIAKRLSPKLAPNAAVAREFLQQAKQSAQIQHPAIARVTDLCREGDDTFIVREFVHGVHIGAIISQIGDLGVQGLSVKYAVMVASAAAAALHHAFTGKDSFGLPLEMIHAGVSPANIFITMDGGVVLTDFGLTRALRHTKRGEVPIPKSRCLYFSPEQWRGLEPSHRADIFSLGTVLWELVTGRRLHDRADLKAIVNAACVDPAPTPSSLQKQASREIDEVTLKALAKRPDDRFAGSDEMHRTLEAYLSTHAKDVSPESLVGYVSALLPDVWKSWQRLRRAEAAADDARIFEEISIIFKGKKAASEAPAAEAKPASVQRIADNTVRSSPPARSAPPAKPVTAPPVAAPAPSATLVGDRIADATVRAPVPAPRPRAEPAMEEGDAASGAAGRELIITDRIPQFVSPAAARPAEPIEVEPEPEPEPRFGMEEPITKVQTIEDVLDLKHRVVSAFLRWKGGILAEAVAGAGRREMTVGSVPGCDFTVPEECVAGAPLRIVERSPHGWLLTVPPGWEFPGGNGSMKGEAVPFEEGGRYRIRRGDFEIDLALASPKRAIKAGLLRAVDWSFAAKLFVSGGLLAGLMVFAIFFVKAAPVTSDSPAVQRHVKFLVSAVKTREKKKEPPPAKEEKIEKVSKMKETKIASTKNTVNIPKWVQPKKSTGKVNDLIASLATGGPAHTVKDAVANLDAVRGSSPNSLMGVFGDLMVPGGMSGLGGLGGGGGEVQTLGGSSVARAVGKVEGGGTGKVRGTVSSVKALAKVDGSIDKEQVIRAINESQHQIQACYERALIGSPGLSGKITFEWVIDPQGKVARASEKSSTMGNPKVSDCILGVIRRIRFPKPSGGSVIITFPFMFRSVS